jgi:hypothetical protein
VPGAQRRRKTITKLSVEDQGELNVLVDQALKDGHDKVGATVYPELEKTAQLSSGGEWAERAMKILTVERLDIWGKDRAREQGSLVSLGDDRSAFVSDVRSHRVRVYEEDGVVIAWQHEIWWQVDWDVLAQMIQIAVSQRDVVDEKVAAMRRGMTLKDQVQGANNVEDACAALGLTVEQFLATPPKAAGL